jgi:hypothetical protein
MMRGAAARATMPPRIIERLRLEICKYARMRNAAS